MSRWEQLLLVQQHDTTADQLRHRSRTLPERTQLEQVNAAVKALDAELGKCIARREELTRSQRRLEDEIAMLNERVAHSDKALYSGTVKAPKDLQALQEEIASIQRRVRTLEDEELDIMELAEPVDAERARLGAEQERLDDEAARLSAAIAESEASIEAELQQVLAARGTAASDIEPDLLEEYESQRHRLGGIAVARLVGSSCGGCHLALSAVEVDRIKRMPPDEPLHCEECGRLLVRS